MWYWYRLPVKQNNIYKNLILTLVIDLSRSHHIPDKQYRSFTVLECLCCSAIGFSNSNTSLTRYHDSVTITAKSDPLDCYRLSALLPLFAFTVHSVVESALSLYSDSTKSTKNKWGGKLVFCCWLPVFMKCVSGSLFSHQVPSAEVSLPNLCSSSLLLKIKIK